MLRIMLAVALSAFLCGNAVGEIGLNLKKETWEEKGTGYLVLRGWGTSNHQHKDSRRPPNENNIGAGVEWRFNDSCFISFDMLRNSVRSVAKTYGAGCDTDLFAWEELHIRLGAQLTRIEYSVPGGPTRIKNEVIPYMTFGYDDPDWKKWALIIAPVSREKGNIILLFGVKRRF